jgi:hypothetical protein
MRTVDERLRAAARDAARIFSNSADLPPLHLPAGAAGQQHPRARQRSHAWLAPIAAASAVALISAGIVVAHHAASQASHASQARAEAARAREQAVKLRRARLKRRLDALIVESVAPVTGLQYDRGSKLIWLVRAQELRATARCMAEAGDHISARSAPFNLALFADNTQMPDLPRIGKTHRFVSGAGVTSTSYPRPEQRAYNACAAKAAVPFRQLMALDQAISGRWWKVIFRAQASARVRAAIPNLSRCATRYGFPSDPYGSSSGPIRTFADFMDWVAGFLDGAGSRGVPATTLRALDRHWSTVFVTCGGPIVGIWQRELRAVQPRFLAGHATQLRRLDRLAWSMLGSQPR